MAASGVIGRDLPTLESQRFVVGKGRYVDDVQLPGMLHVAILRSPHAHARIKRIEVAEALKLPGVRAVLTGKEVAERTTPVFQLGLLSDPPLRVDQWALAVDKVRFAGEGVAAVAATSRALAEDACERIVVDYEPLEPVVSVEAAQKGEGELVHKELGSNVLLHRRLTFGDVEGAFQGASRIVRRRLRWARHTSAPLEPFGVVAEYNAGTGELTFWSNLQSQALVHTLAQTLKLPSHKVRNIPCDIGGAFGGKFWVPRNMVLAALFAMDTGCPVKFMEDRVENFAAGDNHGEDRIYEAEVALDEEARIKGLRFKVIEDYGAYFLLGATGNSSPLSQAVGPYTIGAVGVEFIAVLTNKCGQGAYRGFGAAPMTFVLERLVDAAARETGLDVVEIRRRNLIPPEAFPYRTPVGNLYDSGDYPGALREALEVAEYEVWRRRQREWRKEGRYIGIGVVCAQERSVPSATELWLMYERRSAEPTTSAETVGCRVDAEGQVTLVLHSPSLGTANETVAAMVAAEELGLRPEAIRVCRVDSSLCGPAMGPAGSRMTVMLAGATSGAVLRVREKMRRIAAHILEVAEEDVEYLPGLQRFSVRGAPARFCEFHEVARYAHTRSLDLPAGLSSGLEATFTYEHPLASKPAVGDWGSFNPIIAHSVHIPVVEVDTETGFVSFLDYVVVHDCGTIINPKGVEGQILGGVCQGLGSALYEELVYEEGTGQLLTKTFYDYLVPTCVEMPRVRIFHRCTPSPFTYRGVKGAGEGGRIAAPAAIVAAIEDALAPFGVSVDEIPVTPEKIVRWIEASGLEAQ